MVKAFNVLTHESGIRGYVIKKFYHFRHDVSKSNVSAETTEYKKQSLDHRMLSFLALTAVLLLTSLIIFNLKFED